ncbi:MAG: leucine-rich repeat domain-containing protein [Candidatus Thorarchaeota archaeon]|nr:MAG: leucine-rich repeat domain-containing protein [Candidatus Thorarchaeota archaeon]
MGEEDTDSEGIGVLISKVDPKSRWTNELLESTHLVPSDTRTLDLRGQSIRSIDLRPLTMLPSLEILHLGFNELSEIDLNPLATCVSLTELDLGITPHSGYVGNSIQQIDLNPISKCSELRRLSLSGNQLRSVDLDPLGECERISELDLSRNPLKEIDLTPLSSSNSLNRIDLGFCELERVILPRSKSLQTLSLECNRLASIDLEPLRDCSALIDLGLDGNPLESLNVWPVIDCPRLDLGDQSFFYQKVVLAALGMSELFCYDGDLMDVMRAAKSESESDVRVAEVYRILVSRLEKQIGRRGPTLFLGVEKLSRTQASKLVPLIVERRNEEVAETTVLVSGGVADLRPLLLTEYGFRVMTSLGVDPEVSERTLNSVRDALADIGLELSITRDPCEKRWGVVMSESMKRYIFQLAHQAREREVQLRNPS